MPFPVMVITVVFVRRWFFKISINPLTFLKNFILFLIGGWLQYCDDFCRTSTWISHRYTYIPSLLNLPPHSTPRWYWWTFYIFHWNSSQSFLFSNYLFIYKSILHCYGLWDIYLILFCLVYLVLLSLFILLFKLSQIWPVKAFKDWLLYPLNMSSSFFFGCFLVFWV